MKIGKKSRVGFGEGEKLFQRRALEALPLLVRQAKAGRTIYYSELADELEMPNPRNLNYVLGALGRELELLSSRWGEDKIPPLQCLVVNQQDGTPGEGVGWFVLDKEDFKKRTSAEKKRIVDAMLVGVFEYQFGTQCCNSMISLRCRSPRQLR